MRKIVNQCLSALMVLLCTSNLFAQQGLVRCATDELNTQWRNSHPELEQLFKTRLKEIEDFRALNDTEKKKGKSGVSTLSGPDFIIPVAIHIVASSPSAPENISAAQIQSQMDALNQYMSVYGFKFCLAKYKENGVNTWTNPMPGDPPGINRYYDPTAVDIQRNTLYYDKLKALNNGGE